MSLGALLHAEITRRAEGWGDHLVQATGDDRHRRVGHAAGDIALWLRIANELGWSSSPRPQIAVHGDLARALSGIDQGEPLRDAADWQAAQASIARSLARGRDILMDYEGAEAPAPLIARWRDLRTIERAFAQAEHSFAARTARAEAEPRKEAA